MLPKGRLAFFATYHGQGYPQPQTLSCLGRIFVFKHRPGNDSANPYQKKGKQPPCPGGALNWYLLSLLLRDCRPAFGTVQGIVGNPGAAGPAGVQRPAAKLAESRIRRRPSASRAINHVCHYNTKIQSAGFDVNGAVVLSEVQKVSLQWGFTIVRTGGDERIRTAE